MLPAFVMGTREFLKFSTTSSERVATVLRRIAGIEETVEVHASDTLRLIVILPLAIKLFDDLAILEVPQAPE